MATRIVVALVDDITGKTAARTVRFGLDGATYEIDLADESESELRELLAPWISAARPVGGPAAARRRELASIRRWAWRNGHRVPARGPLPAATVRAYQQAALTR